MTLPTHEQLCQQIIHQAPEAVIVADQEGVIRLWNAGATAIFGHEASEAIGQTLDIIIPENLRARHWEGYHTVMKTGVTRYGKELLAVPAIRQDGTRISLEFSVILLRDATGGVLGIAAIMRDVTARWQQERALRSRLAALEKTG